MKITKALTALLIAALFTGCGQSAETTANTSNTGQAPETEAPKTETQKTGTQEEDLIQETVYVEMEVENYGTIVLELDGKAAPVTVTNFVKLTESGFYDGLTFHRIMDGFMIQGGDPTGTGFGGSSETIKGEFAQNGYNNPISHKSGTISMARNSVSMDSASSQFFICVADDEFLDGAYAAFGHVVEGMDAVMQIAKDAKPTDDNGSIDPKDQPKIISVKVIDYKG